MALSCFMNSHEQAFVESFVRHARQERALLALANPKKRQKFVREFAHHGTYILAPECLRSIKPSEQNTDFEGELRERYILQR